MPLLIIFLVALLLAFVAYLGYVIHKKGISHMELRVHSLHDAKKLLSLPTSSTPQRYLAKTA
ncbi:uncharacterized protein LOC115761129 [Drosophila novamexicana]|uniref:uncharacterized protein LOC115761129 n=1 Tax=Drosophila novamexicana TaxID=47314 RepID=UPI0011E589FF|nr:uncharacterized protein LOC115761129 [Drosophila novamexicana]